ncbi:hypothetical protein [Coleofasciculus sp. FACHB-1120]|nr:hypothetical protein [Coleofasciculus sp. FACHB-1120]
MRSLRDRTQRKEIENFPHQLGMLSAFLDSTLLNATYDQERSRTE